MKRDYAVGIVGVGFVGSAIKQFFEDKITKQCDMEHDMEHDMDTIITHVYAYDKYKEPYNEIPLLHQLIDNSDVIYLCLPTPFDQNNCYDMNETVDILKTINEHVCSCENITQHKCVVSKSTTTPKLFESLLLQILHIDNTSDICTKVGYIHNPEFLSAKTAYEDFCSQKHIVIGKTPYCSNETFEQYVHFNRTLFPHATISTCDSTTSETMKILANNFYASKIMILNEYYLICKKLDINYDEVIDLMLKNGWINPMHTLVPGTDGHLGFGGACFSKDTSALYTYMKNNDMMCGILEKVIDECKNVR